MQDFDIQRFTRRCRATDRELQPGESFYSVLVDEAAQIVRRDYCCDAWRGPPESALGWWKSQVPDIKAKKMNWAPHQVMLHFFTELEHNQDEQDTRYVLTLLMIRRRILKLEETEIDENGQEHMIVFSPHTECEYQVEVVTPNENRIKEIQEELAKLLFADAT